MTAYRSGQVALRYRLEPSELLERSLGFQRALLKRCHAVAAVVVCVTSALLVLRSGATGAASTIVLLSLAALVQRMIVRRRTNLSAWSGVVEGLRDVVLDANPQELKFSMGGTELRYDWAQLEGWEQEGGGLVLHTDRRSSLRVPARAFSSAESHEVLSQLLSTQVGAPKPWRRAVRLSDWIPIAVYDTMLLLLIGTCIELVLHVFFR